MADGRWAARHWATVSAAYARAPFFDDYAEDIARLKAVSTRVLVGLGEDSAGELCDRSCRVLADLLDTAPTMFLGGHVGFAMDPAAFESRLRKIDF